MGLAIPSTGCVSIAIESVTSDMKNVSGDRCTTDVLEVLLMNLAKNMRLSSVINLLRIINERRSFALIIQNR